MPHLRSLSTAAITAVLACFSAKAEVLVMESPQSDVRAQILFLPEDESALTLAPPKGETRLLVTGAYSSGDRFAPEGFVLRRGAASHPYPQGWDGLLLVSKTGDASVHEVSNVNFQGASYNLRERTERAAFLKVAQAEEVSAIQSHLLIKEGALDLSPVEGARRFRRRLLFQMEDGRIGVYDTSPRSLTLYQAAVELEAEIGPKMALNLDMGAYDYCHQENAQSRTSCGLLKRSDTKLLTNIIEFRFSSTAAW